jgi:hypothetical protein
LTLSIIKHHPHEDVQGIVGIAPHISTLALVGLPPGEIALTVPLREGWKSPRVGVDAMEKKEGTVYPSQESNHDSSVV